MTRYPSAEGRWQVYGNGGPGLWASDDAVRWARATHELFFTISGAEPERVRMMVVDVRADRAGVTVGQPTLLFDIDAEALAGGFDLSPDGRTFYLLRRAATSSKGPARRFVLIQNWSAEFTKSAE